MKDSRRRFRYVIPITGECIGYYSFVESQYDNGNTKYQVIDTSNGVVINDVTVDVDQLLSPYQLAVDTRSGMDVVLKSLGIITSSKTNQSRSPEYEIYEFDKIEMDHYVAVLGESRKVFNDGGEGSWTTKNQESVEVKKSNLIQFPTYNQLSHLQMQSR